MMDADRSRYLVLLEKATALLLLAYPVLTIALRGGMNGVFLLMLLLALSAWLVRPAGMSKARWQHEWTIYSAAMLAMTAAILVSQAFHRNFTGHPHDAASRYFLAIPVFLLLQRLRPGVFAVLPFAFPAAAITGFLMARDVGGRAGVGTLDLIHFGDFEMILGMLSLLGIDWFGRDKTPVRAFKILGFIAGLAASFASGSRGGWLAIPVFLAIFIYFKIGRISPRMVLSVLAAAMLAIASLYSFNAAFHQRTNELASDLAAFGQGNRDTSTGIRWQLYKAAVDVFSRHPVFGVGPEGFALEMKPMMEAGKITPAAAEMGRGEVHNDILSKAAGMGIFGLAAMLAIYFVPFWLFWRATKSALAQVRHAGILGIAFVSGFLVFGLTVEVLNLTMAAAFYSFTVAVLLAACCNAHYGEQSTYRL